MDDALATLASEFCPPIDPALFFAIVSDFDITDDLAKAAARETLDAIKASAMEQDCPDFDPSGHAVRVDDGTNEAYLRIGDNGYDTDTSVSGETDLTSVSNGVISLNIEGGTDANSGYVAEAEKQDDASKISMLQEMFPNSTSFTISYTLNKCGGNWNRTLEELLNHTFFDQDAGGDDMIAAKGIEAFSEDHIIRRGRKNKQRQCRKKEDNKPSTRSSSLPTAPAANSWDKASKDIEFLNSRVNVSSKAVSSAYHSNSTSLSATIIALAKTSSSAQSMTSASSQSINQMSAAELGKHFPAISHEIRFGITSLTQPSTIAAHDLANVLTTPMPASGSGGIEIIPRYAPINTNALVGSDGTGWLVASRQLEARSGTSTPTSSFANSTVLANTYAHAQQRSFEQASAAYRRGRSDHLMSGAAAYYSQQGRDFAMKRFEATADAADALVESQSTHNEIDLHGVNVKDSVRIAKQKTDNWWRGNNGRTMGLDGRVRDEGNGKQPLQIVTGLGKHSAGGKAKIGPAVAKALFVDGWKVSVGNGVLSVHGKK